MSIKSIVFTGIALILSTGVHAAPITSLEITGGSFSMAGVVGDVVPATYPNLTIGGYDGSTGPGCGCTLEENYPYSIATVEWGFFGNIGTFTSEADGIRSGFAPVTGDLTGSDLTLDLSAWTFYWNGVVHNNGSSSDMLPNSVCVGANCSTAIITTYDSGTGGFTASWNAVVVGGAHNGQYASWELTGYVSAIPVPAAIWLFGSGLIGLIGVARRKKV